MSTVVTRAASSTSAKPALQKRSRSAAGAVGGKKPSDHIKRRRLEQVPADSDGKDECEPHQKVAASQGEKKWQDYNQHSHQSPFSDFVRPTHEECEHAHRILEDLHGDKVRENFASDIDSVKYPHVMDAVVVAALSQATSWENAKRAMRNMDLVYGSTFAYDSIIQGGEEKLRQVLRPGGMQNRKAVILLGILEQVKQRHGKFDLDFLFDADDNEVMRELLRYKGIGPKCAHCVMSICLKRTTFALDVHCHRIAGFWGWRPVSASRDEAQAHLDDRIPDSLKFPLHYLLIVHGRECPNCKGSGNRPSECSVLQAIHAATKDGFTK
ncbi:hypothetical protein D0862_10722 [Hortaea werneckii]|uniref:HhH-GPD domain-containing protein n=1 Tax=Hortaea werneckii TaxID=91943 RepID=A0A3M7FG63_HORWE|nr:hypothetical protein D0862_10722 [Hortaea werneckii]